MKLCFICGEYPPGPHGGIGTVTQLLARALVGIGHQVRVAGVYGPDYPAEDYEEDRGVRVWRLREPDHPFGWLRARYVLFRKLSRWIGDAEVDLVEVPDWEGVAAGWPRLPVPVVARLHGSASYFAAEVRHRVKRTTFLFERASLRRADFWCSVSRYTAEASRRLFGLRSEPQAVLYNPVEVAAESAADGRSAARVFFSGTLTAKKGIVSLIRAWPAIVSRCGEAELHIFGKDTRTNEGQSMLAFLKSELNGTSRESVRFHGHVARGELLDELRIARVAVFPSYAEGFALAPLEAMSHSCPTIFTRRGSGPELIEDGRSGLLVDPDRPDEIAASVVRVLTDDSLARRLGEAGREAVIQRFSMQKVLPLNESFYQSCVAAFAKRWGQAPSQA